MASSILSIGQSALAAAQVGLSTTSHNIANAATPGFSRQVLVQGTGLSQNYGFGFLGRGTQINDVKRVYNEFLGAQVRTAQTNKSALDSHYAQIRQIDNMLADPSAGLSPGLQSFFSGLQDLATNPSLLPSRQAALSNAEALVARFHSLSGQMKEIEQNVNGQVTASVTTINAYAQQIAQLNDVISKAQGATGKQPNDLLDQRDQLILDLNKEIRTTVVKQSDGGYNVFIGNGQPLVVGATTSQLAITASPTNPERIEVAYRAPGGALAIVSETSLAGGKLGGLVAFRSQSLEPAQNALGRVAIGLAMRFNAQHQQGVDLNGNPGGTFFTLAAPSVQASANNTGGAEVVASISDANALTTSDYRITYDGTNYTVTRLSDNVSTAPFAAFPQTIDGVTLDIDITNGAAQAGDAFLVRPTVNGATGIGLAITDPARIAAAGALPVVPVGATAGAANAGDVAISAPTVDGSYTTPLPAPVSFTYDATTDPLNPAFTVAPATGVTVTVGGVPTVYPPGDPVPYTEGATYSFGGISFVLSSPSTTPPVDGDVFTVAANPAGPGDNRNALLLADLQTARILGNGSATLQGAYSQLVSEVGNKSRELQVTSTAAGRLLTETNTALQAESGVNLDEEATNLLRYQQAYQAAGKVMQVASDMFDVLLSLGR
ncbi:MAG: flagellar hook-associated protein FlgK [Gammaproteobacteria bacterium]